jgi:metal-responsive CopG/Arc/MetJ family transcriptional regulator
MKTAVSIPDDLFKKAEKVAKQKKITRSKLYAAALKLYLLESWREEAIRRTNAVVDATDTRMPPPMQEAVRQRLRKVQW